MSRGFTVWLTGLSGAGKSTIAQALAPVLRARGLRVEVLDGDAVREHLSKGLGFSKEDRDTNIRRIGFVAPVGGRTGVGLPPAAIPPYRQTGAEVPSLIGDSSVVYVRCSLAAAARRDVKGLYARALRGEIPNFTGVSDPYEEPLNPEVVVDTERETVEESVARILRALEERGYVPAPELAGEVPA